MKDETVRREVFWNQRIEHNIARSGVPAHTRKTRRLGKLTVTNGNRKAFAAVKDFLELMTTPPILLLIGVPGVGKTSLAYAIAWEFLEEGSTVLYYQAEELLNDLQALIENGKEYGRLRARLKDADLVILDDLGAHNPSKWRDAQLDALVDYRYREELPLVMTVNKLDVSERILDRVKEGTSAVITGASWRGKIASEKSRGS